MGLAQVYRLVAGSVVFVTAGLGIWVHPAFLWVTLFVGANLFQSGITNWCPLLTILRRAGFQG